MLFPLLISLLVVATLALFAIGGMLIHQQRLERAERRAVADDPTVVTLGDLTTEIDAHFVAFDLDRGFRSNRFLFKQPLQFFSAAGPVGQPL